ncbi:hypothetical protein NKR23_g10790 [Pleurostoma richardsiae]|uniref:Uncharacterized protein n=1 Tax=Pleurostoma richardsiae TaxID=41990 RepID=A0AA38RLC8_9PEZI|nr:hypothetical protein NKR23_g10790 [Pleurostoma richardsiae]
MAAATPLRLLRSLAASLYRRASDSSKCDPDNSSINLCEKPADSNSETWLIVSLAFGVLVLGTVCALVFLHFRRLRRDKREEMSPQELEEYGLDLPPPAPGAASPSKWRRLSPRMKPAEPDERHMSVDSWQSLARSLRSNKDDPFGSNAEIPGVFGDEQRQHQEHQQPQQPQVQMQQRSADGLLKPPTENEK